MTSRLTLLGGHELQVGKTVVQFRSAKVMELLAYLALQRDGRASRSAIAGALYPDSFRSRENLRQTLLYLGKAAPDAVVSSGSWLTLQSVDSDVAEFLNGDLDAYGGDLLPGYSGEWLASARADMEQRYIDLALTAASAALPRDPQRAAHLALKVIQLDPYLEQARRIRWLALEEMGEPNLIAKERLDYSRFIFDEIGLDIRSSWQVPTPSASLSPAERLLSTIAMAPMALEQGRLVGAAHDLERAIGEMEGHPYLPMALIALTRMQYEMGETAAAFRSVQRASGLPLTHIQKQELEVLASRIYARQSKHAESRKLAQRGLKADVPELRAEAHLVFSYFGWANGDYLEALRHADEALTIAEKANLVKIRVRAQHTKGTLFFRDGRPTEAIQVLEEGIAAARSISRLDLEASLTGDLGRVLESLGDYASAKSIYQELLTRLEKSDYRVDYAQAATYLADLEHRLSNFEEARRLHVIGIATRKTIGDYLGLATSYRGKGKAELALGANNEAISSLRTSLRYFARIDDPGSFASARVPLARALYATDEKAEARRQLERAALELIDLSADSILARYNDSDLLPAKLRELRASMTG